MNSLHLSLASNYRILALSSDQFFPSCGIFQLTHSSCSTALLVNAFDGNAVDDFDLSRLLDSRIITGKCDEHDLMGDFLVDEISVRRTLDES